MPTDAKLNSWYTCISTHGYLNIRMKLANSAGKGAYLPQNMLDRKSIYIIPKFSRLKFSPKAHTLYWDKKFAKFNFVNHASYLPGSSGWSS